MFSEAKVGRYLVEKIFVEKKELADEDMKEERMMNTHILTKAGRNDMSVC